MHENLGEDRSGSEREREREREIESGWSNRGPPEGLWDPREMVFDTGNRSVVVVTKSRKTGPLRPRCSERDWRKESR